MSRACDVPDMAESAPPTWRCSVCKKNKDQSECSNAQTKKKVGLRKCNTCASAARVATGGTEHIEAEAARATVDGTVAPRIRMTVRICCLHCFRKPPQNHRR